MGAPPSEVWSIGFKYFVETGTYLGQTSYLAGCIFDQVYTIEASEKLYQSAKFRLSTFGNIKLIYGDSSIELRKVVGRLEGPAVFWLDAHYSGGITEKMSKECPLMEELDAIMESPHRHAIYIDDARLFAESTNDWPRIPQIYEKLKSKYMVQQIEDYIRAI